MGARATCVPTNQNRVLVQLVLMRKVRLNPNPAHLPSQGPSEEEEDVCDRFC